jgi:hypothetical protein
MPRSPRPAARTVIELPGRTSRTIPANGVSRGSVSVPPAIRHRFRHVKRSSPLSSLPARPSTDPDQRPPGCGSGGTGTWTSSRLGSRSRSAIGAPTTTESPPRPADGRPASAEDDATGATTSGRRHDDVGRHVTRDSGPDGACQVSSTAGRSARSGRRSGRRGGRQQPPDPGDIDRGVATATTSDLVGTEPATALLPGRRSTSSRVPVGARSPSRLRRGVACANARPWRMPPA